MRGRVMRRVYDGTMACDWASVGQPAWNRMFLYLLGSKSDELLYVGITWNVKNRWQQHRLKKEWWPDVATAQVYEYGAKDEASAVRGIRQVEKYYIETFLPLKNITGPANLPSKAGAV